MRNPNHPGGGSAGLCPRLLWRSANPQLPVPKPDGQPPPACVARWPDCCAASSVVDHRRAA